MSNFTCQVKDIRETDILIESWNMNWNLPAGQEGKENINRLNHIQKGISMWKMVYEKTEMYSVCHIRRNGWRQNRKADSEQ
jgi:hypothetical protein